MRLLEQSQKNRADPKVWRGEASLINCDFYEIKFVQMAQVAE